VHRHTSITLTSPIIRNRNPFVIDAADARWRVRNGRTTSRRTRGDAAVLFRYVGAVEKGKAVARRGRKTTGPGDLPHPESAGLPKHRSRTFKRREVVCAGARWRISP